MKRWSLLFFAAILLICPIYLWSVAEGDDAPSALEITVFDAGKADAILIQTEGGAVLIDAGTEDFGMPLLLALREKGIRQLDALIITHFDKDHVGGADQILDAMPVLQVYEPDYFKDSKQYRQYRQSLDRIHQTPIKIQTETEITPAGLALRVLPAQWEDYGKDKDNEFSLVASLRFGDTSYLFTGDAENARLAELLRRDDLAHDFLKVPHHGRADALSYEFLQAVQAKYAVITSSEEDQEDAEVTGWLEASGATVYLTRYGDVSIHSDGKTIEIRQGATNSADSAA